MACAVSTDPCGEDSGSTCDINNICPDSKKATNTNSYNNNYHLSNPSLDNHIITKHSSSEVKGNVSMPAFLEVFDMPKDQTVLVMNDLTEKYRFTEDRTSTR